VKNKEDKLNLVGDIVVSSGIIAYLGVFSMEYREEAINEWIKLMKTFQIISTPDFTLSGVLGVGVKI